MRRLPVDQIGALLADLIEGRQPDNDDVITLIDVLRRCQSGLSWGDAIGSSGTFGIRLRDGLLLEAAELLDKPKLSTWGLAGRLAEQTRRFSPDAGPGALHALLVQASRCGRLPTTQQGIFNVLRQNTAV